MKLRTLCWPIIRQQIFKQANQNAEQLLVPSLRAGKNVMISLAFVSDWLRTWCEIFSQSLFMIMQHRKSHDLTLSSILDLLQLPRWFQIFIPCALCNISSWFNGLRFISQTTNYLRLININGDKMPLVWIHSFLVFFLSLLLAGHDPNVAQEGKPSTYTKCKMRTKFSINILSSHEERGISSAFPLFFLVM